jgi:DNA-binding protein H-NS
MHLNRWGNSFVGNAKMKVADLKSMSVDELLVLREQIDSVLSIKISEEMQELAHRLVQIKRRGSHSHARRRHNPPVYPKYRNPGQPSETWSGRGMRPRWLTAQLRLGKNLDDFRIRPS